jgi:signal transduction histidine kinase
MRTMATVIERHHGEIVSRWSEGARRAAFSEGLSSPELAGMIPAYLSLLGRNRAGEPELSAAQHQLIEQHLSNRLRQGSALNEILTELAVLGRSVRRCLEDEPEAERPSSDDIAGVFAELSATCVAVTRIFTEHMLEDEQTEKRYVRLLHEIGGDSIAHGHALPVAAHIRAALAMILKAMDGRAVALHLSDPETGAAILAASAGEGAEELERSSTDLHLLAGSSSEPAVSDAFRALGFGAVLTVAMSTRHLLSGTLHLGLGVGRELTASDSRRLQALADALAVHLETVRLIAALREHADRAAAETELRDRFVSILMHDLGGPLASARACARRLAHEGVGHETEAARLEAHLARAEAMVGGLVDAHRIRSGHRLPMAIAECDLGDLTGLVVDELRAVHGDRFVVRAEERVRGMWSADQLRRAIANLCANALQHGARGAVVSVTVARRGDAARVSVHNHGPALDREARARLIRPFSVSRPGHGTPPGWGLGLTLVWGCAEAHGGRLEVESAPGKGTTFTLGLPFDARPYADRD